MAHEEGTILTDICFATACYGVDKVQSAKWFCRRCEPHSTVRITKVVRFMIG
jgi:hypothetical protein